MRSTRNQLWRACEALAKAQNEANAKGEDPEKLQRFFRRKTDVVIDVKSIFDRTGDNNSNRQTLQKDKAILQ